MTTPKASSAAASEPILDIRESLKEKMPIEDAN